MKRRDKKFLFIIIATMLLGVFLPTGSVYSHFFMCLAALELSLFFIYGGISYNSDTDQHLKEKHRNKATSPLPGEKIEDKLFNQIMIILPWWVKNVLFITIGILFLMGTFFLIRAFFQEHF